MPYVIVSFVAMWLVLKTEGSCHLCHYAKSWFPFWNGSHTESADFLAPGGASRFALFLALTCEKTRREGDEKQVAKRVF